MSFDMTHRIAEEIGKAARFSRQAAALNFICGTLIAYDSAAGRSPFGGLDVERVFAAVELLGERHQLEVTPFVASWHAAVDAWDQQEVQTPPFFDDQLRKAVTSDPAYPRASGLINQLIDARIGTRTTGATYKRLASLMLDALRQLVATTRKDVGYLRPLVIEGQRTGGLTIATLNYDVAVESAADVAGIPLTTGLRDWIEMGEWDWPNDGIRLLKLHGSIDWTWHRETKVGSVPTVSVSLQQEGGAPPAVIFGQRAKLRAEGPFLSLLAEFERQLASAHRLVVIGYSFRDDHVNEIIRRWIAEDESRTLLVVDPKWPERYTPATTDFRAVLEAYLIPRKGIRAGAAQPFEPRIEIWRKRCGEALRDLAMGVEAQE